MFDGGEFGRMLAIEVKAVMAPLHNQIAMLERRIGNSRRRAK